MDDLKRSRSSLNLPATPPLKNRLPVNGFTAERGNGETGTSAGQERCFDGPDRPRPRASAQAASGRARMPRRAIRAIMQAWPWHYSRGYGAGGPPSLSPTRRRIVAPGVADGSRLRPRRSGAPRSRHPAPPPGRPVEAGPCPPPLSPCEGSRPSPPSPSP